MERNNIWFVKSHEPLPLNNQNARLWRTGIFAKILSEELNFNVTWFSSNFDHFHRTFYTLEKQDKSHNLNIELVPTPGYKNNRSIRRLMDHLVFGLKFLKVALKREKPDIIICSFPTFSSALSVLIYSKIKSVKYIIDYRDHWPELFWQNTKGYKRVLIKFLTLPHSILTSVILKNAYAKWSVSDYVLELAQKKSSLQKNDSTIYIPYQKKDTYDENKVDKTIKDFFNSNIESQYFAYIGTIGFLGDVETILKSQQYVKKEDNIKFIICGTGDRLIEWRNRYSSSNVMFTGFIGEDSIKFILGRCAVGILSYKNLEIWQKTITNKFIEYLSEGLFLVNPLSKGTMYDLIGRNNLGVTYMEGNPISFYETIRNIDYKKVEESRSDRIRFYENNFGAEMTLNKLKSALKNILK